MSMKLPATLLLLTLAVRPADAQPPTVQVPPASVGTDCSRFVYSVEVTVHSRTGTPMTDGSIRVVRARDQREVKSAFPTAIGSGQYQVIADDDVALVPVNGAEAFLVRVENAAERAEGTLLIERSGGCHVRKASGQDTLRAVAKP